MAAKTKARKSRAEREIERMAESGYKWPRPTRHSIYVYPAQLDMIDQICRDWHTTRREVFLTAIQNYIHAYITWRDSDKEGGR